MEFILDNYFLFFLVILLSYVIHVNMFKVYKNDLEPEDLANAYFLLKRNVK